MGEIIALKSKLTLTTKFNRRAIRDFTLEWYISNGNANRASNLNSSFFPIVIIPKSRNMLMEPF